ncbi:unnamed protein product [Ectocarpus sp. 12 AP-2014]
MQQADVPSPKLRQASGQLLREPNEWTLRDTKKMGLTLSQVDAPALIRRRHRFVVFLCCSTSHAHHPRSHTRMDDVIHCSTRSREFIAREGGYSIELLHHKNGRMFSCMTTRERGTVVCAKRSRIPAAPGFGHPCPPPLIDSR